MIDFTNWKYYTNIDKNGNIFNNGITIIHSNGMQESRSLQDPDVVKWLEEGNTPLPADE